MADNSGIKKLTITTSNYIQNLHILVIAPSMKSMNFSPCDSLSTSLIFFMHNFGKEKKKNDIASRNMNRE